ncbi:HAD-IB family phosphatase [Ferroplasma sp.]|uniref:HAD-IB family phosphatase n=1 Tax=Ferroplasma sp. TaxID=2591003 RepID=UPI00262C8282|nr:HAD-IB family phosphatase [Ferroplasma sp.]MCL4453863.1 HAD-IB family phosphatase [Candidatus Thermoplasmatota archaeon]
MIKLAFFDMDGVLTVEKSSWFYVNNKLGINNRENYMKYMKGQLPYPDFFRLDLKAWIEKYPGIEGNYIKNILNEIKPVTGLGKTMKYLKNKNIISVIVSGGISWLSDRIARDYGIYEAYANKIYCDDNGRIIPDGEVQVDPSYKDYVMGKVMAKYGLKPGECIAVGDSESDYSMYRAVPNFIAFNSDSDLLLKISSASMENDLSGLIKFLESY